MFYEVKNIPIIEYLDDPLLKRLKKVGYFCGMDYASKDVYNFSEYISRYDHSLNVALLTYYLTKDEVQSIAGLYHDVATPCLNVNVKLSISAESGLLIEFVPSVNDVSYTPL